MSARTPPSSIRMCHAVSHYHSGIAVASTKESFVGTGKELRRGDATHVGVAAEAGHCEHTFPAAVSPATS